MLPSRSSSYDAREYRYEVKYRLIGYCGSIHPLIIVNKKVSGLTTILEGSYFYDEKKLMIYLAEEKVKFTQYRDWLWRKDYSLSTTDGLTYFFDQKSWSHFLPYFQKHKAPVFLIGSRTLILNPCLKEYKFQQVKDPYSAFQDIFMYISGVLGVESKKIVEISDKDKAEAKGHGGKYSFRKTPGKRGKNRWR